MFALQLLIQLERFVWEFAMDCFKTGHDVCLSKVHLFNYPVGMITLSDFGERKLSHFMNKCFNKA